MPTVEGKVAVVTGAAGGIGEALARRLVDAGAKVAITDLDKARLDAVANSINAASEGSVVAVAGDASKTADIAAVIAAAESAFGPVDAYFANAGIIGQQGLGEDDDLWDTIIDINVLAHVRAARLLVDGWIERGGGIFVSTASAAGLLSQIGAASYSVTKHAAVGFAEWLSLTYGDRGIHVSCLCPQGVNTPMLNQGIESNDGSESAGTKAVKAGGDVLEPEQVANAVIATVEEEQFLVLPHPEVLEYYRRKGADYDRWLRGMRRLQARVGE